MFEINRQNLKESSVSEDSIVMDNSVKYRKWKYPSCEVYGPFLVHPNKCFIRASRDNGLTVAYSLNAFTVSVLLSAKYEDGKTFLLINCN